MEGYMSDVSTAGKLEIIPTIKEGIGIGLKNLVPILVNVILWALTIWIPYLNVGTTIGLLIGIVSKASKGESIGMTEIFDAKYRKYIGEFFLTSGLMGIGIAVGTAFFIIPGIVIALAWSLALLLVIDKGKNPTEALVLSNNRTYGYKFKMFGILFLTCLAFGIVQGILLGISGLIGIGAIMFIFGLLVFAIALVEIFALIGVQASIYKQLAGDA